MQHDTKKVEHIVKWREQLSRLSDHHFFEIMRMYLGEVKTPYNKQKLIEELSSFLRKEDTKKNILLLLSRNDIQILSAIEHIPNPTQNVLLDFFSKKFTFAQLHEELLNLEERLLIFRFADQKKVFFAINPLLYETLEPALEINNLFTDETMEIGINLEEVLTLPKIPLSSSFIGALISFLTIEKGFIKIDNNFRKRSLPLAKIVFPHLYVTNSRTEEPIFLRSMINAMRNLQLITWDDGTITQNYDKWELFADLSDLEQYSYLVASSACNRPARSLITNYAQLTYQILKSIPAEGISIKMLNRIIFLLAEKNESIVDASSNGRLNALFDRANDTTQNENTSEKEKLLKNDKKNLIEKMFLFSLLEYKDDKIFASHLEATKTADGHFLRSDGGFSMSIFPEMRLKNLLSLIVFFNIVSFDVVSKYEITKQSCQRAFDSHLTPKEMFDALETNMSTPINQTLQFSIEDWFKNYSEVALYKGYVLEFSADKIATITANKHFQSHVGKKFSDTLYMMNFTSDDEAIKMCQKIGLEFITNIKRQKKVQSVSAFIHLSASNDVCKNSFFQPANDFSEITENKEKEVFLENMKKALHEKKMTHEQNEILETRINRKIILSADQLRTNSVRFEVNEAQGIDFLGKVRIIEYAISIESMVELSYEDKNEVILGIPLSTEKQEGDVLLKMQVEPNSEIHVFSIGKAAFVKRIRGSIFKEGS
ncbi:MAG: helicase-associated domain-containing protein [Treponemataceae bacterium]